MLANHLSAALRRKQPKFFHNARPFCNTFNQNGLNLCQRRGYRLGHAQAIGQPACRRENCAVVTKGGTRVRVRWSFSGKLAEVRAKVMTTWISAVGAPNRLDAPIAPNLRRQANSYRA